MHSSRSTTIIGAGVAVAILGAILVFAYTRSLQGSAGAAAGPSASAFVASAAIATGTKGEAVPSSVKQTGVPTAARPADAVTSLSQLSGLHALRAISAGEVISASQFGAAGAPSIATTGLTIPAGYNAITVTAPVPQAVGGYVNTGDVVNMFMTFKDAQGTRLLLSNVTVLATVPASTAASAKAGAAPAPATGDVFFTLALTPQQAEKVIFAQTYAGLWYGLVHPGDGIATTSGQTLATLFK